MVEYIRRLSERAAFVNVEAILLLYRISDSAELREQAESAAKTLIGKRPELAQMMRTDLEGIGVHIRGDEQEEPEQGISEQDIPGQGIGEPDQTDNDEPGDTDAGPDEPAEDN